MDKETFIKRIENSDTSLDEKYIKSIIQKSIESNLNDGNPRGHRNLIIAMEESSELIKEISKYLRGKGEYIGILEELADAKIGMYYIQEICGIRDDEINKAINVKIENLENGLNKYGHLK